MLPFVLIFIMDLPKGFLLVSGAVAWIRYMMFSLSLNYLGSLLAQGLFLFQYCYTVILVLTQNENQRMTQR